jgi:hypothetical protein
MATAESSIVAILYQNIWQPAKGAAVIVTAKTPKKSRDYPALK